MRHVTTCLLSGLTVVLATLAAPAAEAHGGAARGGVVVVRPPIGLVVRDLPGWRTVLVVGGLTYLLANGVYYRERSDGGYEVVAPPAELPPVPERAFVAPRQGQSPQQQATDEYECHRWAVAQSGFDPSGVATGRSLTVSTSGRSDYQRARFACLEGRGYVVR